MMLTVWQCEACGQARLSGRRLCSACGSERFTETALPSVGHVLAVTRVHIAPTGAPMAKPPFTLCLVKTGKGNVQFMGVSEEELAIGDTVVLTFDRSTAPYMVAKQPKEDVTPA